MLWGGIQVKLRETKTAPTLGVLAWGLNLHKQEDPSPPQPDGIVLRSEAIVELFRSVVTTHLAPAQPSHPAGARGPSHPTGLAALPSSEMPEHVRPWVPTPPGVAPAGLLAGYCAAAVNSAMSGDDPAAAAASSLGDPVAAATIAENAVDGHHRYALLL